MNSVKVLCVALSASATLHAVFLGYSLLLPSENRHLPDSEWVQIEEVRVQRDSAVVSQQPVKPAAAPAPKKQKHPPRPKKQTVPVERSSFSEFQQMMEEKIHKQLQQLKQMDASESSPQPSGVRQGTITTAMSSAELLSDPVKGKIFLSYYGRVKKKIQDTVYQKTSGDLYGHGSVSVVFILNAEGKLEKTQVMDKETRADETMKALAVKCLREAAPFGPFPKNLGSSRIAFNITIFFAGKE